MVDFMRPVTKVSVRFVGTKRVAGAVQMQTRGRMANNSTAVLNEYQLISFVDDNTGKEYNFSVPVMAKNLPQGEGRTGTLSFRGRKYVDFQ